MTKLFYKFSVSSNLIKFTKMKHLDDDDAETIVALYCLPRRLNNEPIQLFAELADAKLVENNDGGLQIHPIIIETNAFSEDGSDNGNDHALSVGNSSCDIVIRNDPEAHILIVGPDATHAFEFPKYLDIIPAYLMLEDPESEELFVGQIFASKDECVDTIKRYSLKMFVDYRVADSKSTIYAGECWKLIEGYKWWVRVTFIQRFQQWEIRKYVGPHTCISAHMMQGHRKLDSKTICNCILAKVKDDPTIVVSMLIAKISKRLVVAIRRSEFAKRHVTCCKSSGYEVEPHRSIRRWANLKADMYGQKTTTLQKRFRSIEPCSPSTFELVLDRNLNRKPKGHSHVIRIRNDMDIRETVDIKHCGVCKLTSHNQKKYPHRNYHPDELSRSN
ncbi:hypothetical protein PVK06_019830 [Gossypium arboreum]|uniref:Uncharacterized protein n=1 Tax=Gossypium arboreum TaxID=29729 RepID=A0ABR0PL10_GOSAR|nr:hypothetical protein PVK06_019830 [Gossypium arboreum]